MNGLPADLDLSFFTGSTFVTAGFAKYQTFLTFREGINVIIEGTFSVNQSEPVGIPEGHDLLIPLLEQDVARAIAGKNGTLEILFVNGSTLYIHDSNQKYESYSVTAPGQLGLYV